MTMPEENDQQETMAPPLPMMAVAVPHAYHQQLPAFHKDRRTAVPYITTFAARKVAKVLELAHSITLDEAWWTYQPENEVDEKNKDVVMQSADDEDEEAAEDDDDDDDDDPHVIAQHHSLSQTIKQCSRLSVAYNALEPLKAGGIQPIQLATIVLHLLRLVTCTVTYQRAGATRIATLHYDNVGYISAAATDHAASTEYAMVDTKATLDAEIQQDFALPSPAREALLNVCLSIVGHNKGPLRAMSNASLASSARHDDSDRLVIHWRAMLKLLLRTAPYLDETKPAKIMLDASSRHNTVLKRTVQLLRDARHFFDNRQDAAAVDLWSSLEKDIMYHSHTHACYRGSILLYLLLPSRCSSVFYQARLPLYLQAWSNIDRCPEYDYLWLTLLCRARKHQVDHVMWRPVRRRLLTNLQYWLQLPVGGTALDKSYPQAPNPRSRSCPARLKVFCGVSSSLEEGIDFISKVAKLLVTCLGQGHNNGDGGGEHDSNINQQTGLTEGTADVLRLLLFMTPYCHPSNLGPWTFSLGVFLHYFSYELCNRVGTEAGLRTLRRMHPDVYAAVQRAQPGLTAHELPPGEVAVLLDALVPLCQQALYSKNGHVGRAGEAAMLYLVQIDPIHTAPVFLDFACQALDVTAVNLSHQAPAALSALTRLVQPALRSDPSILLARLPALLQVSLAGIDSNDQNKTIRTLILYRSLVSWLPIGGKVTSWPAVVATEAGDDDEKDGTMRLDTKLFEDLTMLRESDEYRNAIQALPDTSLLKSTVATMDPTILVTEASSALADWASEFLDRIYMLLRASGQREKRGKGAGAAASIKSSAAVQQARNFSRVLKETLMQVFVSMDDDTYERAVRSVGRFLEGETLPDASKNASILCQAVAATRHANGDGARNEGLNILVPILTDNIGAHSAKTMTYRLRCLAGAVRFAGTDVLRHKDAIRNAARHALSSDDRHLFKTGCKLLRHLLTTQSESFVAPAASRARVGAASDSGCSTFGQSAQLHHDAIEWHVPTAETIEFAGELLCEHVLVRLDALCCEQGDESPRRALLREDVDLAEIRRCLRVVRYAFRGGASLLLDSMSSPGNEYSSEVPYEQASLQLVGLASHERSKAMAETRARTCSFILLLSTIIASDTIFPNTKISDGRGATLKALLSISSDPKICKETTDVALLLLTRRGAAFRSQESKSIWKAQKQLSADYCLIAQSDVVIEALQAAGQYHSFAKTAFRDGEEGGKVIPRRLIATRLQLFHDSLQRNASFEIPRELRRVARKGSSRQILFSVKSDVAQTIEAMEKTLGATSMRPLDLYEGVIDGLYALCCHSNTRIRAAAIGVVDYSMTRFGWLVHSRVPRLLDGLALRDHDINGKFGIPSCSSLSHVFNQQDKRKRLAEAIKGICSILALQRSVKVILSSERLRLHFLETMCSSDELVKLLPPEEMQKVILYLHNIFSPFRSRLFALPRSTRSANDHHQSSLLQPLSVLNEKIGIDRSDTTDANDGAGAVHWRKMLFAAWSIAALSDKDDIVHNAELGKRVWDTSLKLIKSEMGQPLQRVALGIFGKCICLKSGLLTSDVAGLLSEPFCTALCRALVFDHREDSRIGGGHDAQWSTGVEDMVRDSTRHIAPRTLFPFQRTSQSSNSFKVSHCQLVEHILLESDYDLAMEATRTLLNIARDLAKSSPSEDQKNEQISSAEIYAGVCGSWLRRECGTALDTIPFNALLSFLEEAMNSVPFSLAGAYFDALRYAVQFAARDVIYPYFEWLLRRIEATLWRPSLDNNIELDVDKSSETQARADSFSTQSKWMYLLSSILIEFDNSDAITVAERGSWYSLSLTIEKPPSAADLPAGSKDPWELITDALLPRLLAALGHPLDNCRDHIARLLFRICYCYRKGLRVAASRAPSRSSSAVNIANMSIESGDPGSMIINAIKAISEDDELEFRQRCNALSTARLFVSYCAHLGEAKFEFAEHIVPLLPTAFYAMRSSVDDDIASKPPATAEEDAAKRALETDVIKAWRLTLADVSVTAVLPTHSQLDIDRVLTAIETATGFERWQIRQAAVHYLRCFQGAHRFIMQPEHVERIRNLAVSMLGDSRREVSSAAMAALTGIVAASPVAEVSALVKKHASIASKSKMKRSGTTNGGKVLVTANGKDADRAQAQQRSVYLLCACIMSRPYDSPVFVPIALTAISKHSYERNAPLNIRDTVKRCCADYKKTHMSDNWEIQRKAFTTEQLEALEDVISSPHYYA